MTSIPPPPPPTASALQDLVFGPSARLTLSSPESQQHRSLALQIAHNLRYQHNWSDVRLHFPSSRSSTSTANTTPETTFARPVLSGVPPQRLYVHPDEQIEFLQRQALAEKNAKSSAKTSGGGESGKQDFLTGGTPEMKLATEREWVLPSHLREKWSLRRFATVFDALEKVPTSRRGGELLFDGEVAGGSENGDAGESEDEDGDEDEDPGKSNPWRMGQPKRLLLATLDDDSTVVYYIVHDGIVKPRQN